MFQAIGAAGRKAWRIHSAWRKLGGCRVFFMTGVYNGRRSGARSQRMELEGLRCFKKGHDRIRFASILAASCSLVSLEDTKQEVVVGLLIINES